MPAEGGRSSATEVLQSLQYFETGTWLAVLTQGSELKRKHMTFTMAGQCMGKMDSLMTTKQGKENTDALVVAKQR